MAAHTNGASATHAGPNADHGPTPPKITIYTNHGCPYAHRAHIALAELNLPHEEVIIDLSKPRPQWYLDLNPRGLVPTIAYSVPGLFDTEELIFESGVIAQFLADSFPGPFLPASKESPTSALQRARINLLVDAWNSKVGPHMFPMFMAAETSAKEEFVAKIVGAVEKEIEPLLANAGPFFNGSEELTLAEAYIAPFLVRLYDSSEDGELAPKSLKEGFEKLPNFARWAKAVRARPSVTGIYDKEKVLEMTKGKVVEWRAAKKQ
jgi:glutathione S-transferase